MIYLVAGNANEAYYWAREWKLDRREWRYAANVSDLRGLHEADIRLCGRWYARPDADELEWAVEYHGRKPVTGEKADGEGA